MALLSLFPLIVSSIVSVVSGQTPVNIMQRTLPAYTVAVKAETILPPSSACSCELSIFKDAVDNRKLWALKVLDSSGKPKSGFLYGNNYWLGSQFQCLDSTNKEPFTLSPELLKNASKFRKIEDEFPPFKVNYFAAHIQQNSTLQYHTRMAIEDIVILGLCLPAACTTDQLSLVLNAIFQDQTFMVEDLYEMRFKLELVKDLQDDHKWLMNGKMITVLLALVITIVLMTVGTIYDILIYEKYRKDSSVMSDKSNNTKSNNSKNGAKCTANASKAVVPAKIERPGLAGEIVTCFSVYTNTKIMFDTELGPDAVAPLNGIRFFGMVMVVSIHASLYLFDAMDNKPTALRIFDDLVIQPIRNGNVVIDMFFVMGGFLVAYPYFKAESKRNTEAAPVSIKSKAGDFFSMVLKRFIRLTPAYMMTIGLAEIHSNWYDKTTPYYMTEKTHVACAKYWWRNILYIHNFFPSEDTCMTWSWYLSNDMQFFILGNFLVMLSSVYFHMTAKIMGFILVSSAIVTGYVSYIYGFVQTADQQLATFHALYTVPWSRIGPYIVGLVTGYIVIRLDNKLTLRKSYIVILWLLASVGWLSTVYGLAFKSLITVLSSAFYSALSHTVNGISFAWIIIACVTNNGGFFNTFFSFRVWGPLSKLTYGVYLLNPIIIIGVYQNSEHATHFEYLTIMTMSLGFSVISFVCAYVFSLMMEMPYVRILRLLTRPRR